MMCLVINKFPTVWKPCPWEFIHENEFENVFCEIAAILSRGDELSLFRGPHAFACGWLAQDSAVYRAWTSVEQSRHYKTDSTLVGHYVDHSWYTPTELRHRDGCRCPGVKKGPGHHQPLCWCDYVYNACQGYHITCIKQTMCERGRAVGHPSVAYWRVRPPTTIMHYVIFKSGQWNIRLKACMKACLQSSIRSLKSPFKIRRGK